MRDHPSVVASHPDVAERSGARLTRHHLARMADLARADRTEKFARNPRWSSYGDRVLLVALCQGAALHYLDGVTGVKDLDVWTFYAEDPTVGPYPARWPRRMVDFGPSMLGRHPDDVGFVGRHVDLIGRSLPMPLDSDPIEAVRDYLRRRSSKSPRLLAEKAVIALDPPALRGHQVWPDRPR